MKLMGNSCSLLCIGNKNNKIYPIEKKDNLKLKKSKKFKKSKKSKKCSVKKQSHRKSKKSNYVIISQESIFYDTRI